MPDNDRTKTKDQRNLSLDDLVNPRVDQPIVPTGGNAPASKTVNTTPALDRANAAQTRAAVANVTHTDQMRDLMNRMRDVGDDEISDQEAARRAGHSQGGAAASTTGVEPRTPENLPAVQNTLPKTVQQDLDTISQDIKARDGKVYPKWHTINNLPGYMQRAIRAMGRGMFKMFTNTDLEDIITIANVGGQGPNSNLEMQAVANWLAKNAEDLGSVNIDYSQVMPGYSPEVKEYKTNTTRFHVVRDQFGVYIYAYPEQDSVEYSSQPAITSGDDDRDEFGAPIKKRIKETTMTTTPDKFQKIAEMIDQLGNPNQSNKTQAVPKQETVVDQLKWHKAVLEDLNDQAELISFGKESLNEFINTAQTANVDESEVLDEASTLIPLIKDAPGGEALGRYMHIHDKVAATAEWDKVPSGDRVQLKLFKASPDFFMVIKGSNGVAAAKPDLDYFTKQIDKYKAKGKTYQAGGDNYLVYKVIAFSGDMRVDNMLIPDEYEYELNDDGEETNKIKKERVFDDEKQKYVERPVVKVDNSALRKRGTLNPTAAPTLITIRRAGRPYQKEPGGQQNFFDMLKGAIGKVEDVYIATSKVGGLPRRDAEKWVQDYEAGLIPPPDKNDGDKFISAPKSNEIGSKKGAAKVWDPEQKKWVWGPGSERVPAGSRSAGASARDVAANREKARSEFRPGQYVKGDVTSGKGVARALQPVINKFMHKKFAQLKDRITRYTAAENDKAAADAIKLRQNVREIMTALDTANPNWNSAPLRKLADIVTDTVSSYTPKEELPDAMRQISSLRAPAVQKFWDEFVDQLDNTGVWSRYYY